MQNRNEGNDDKARVLRSQLDLCRRLAQESSDPDLAEKLRNLAEKLKHEKAGQEAGPQCASDRAADQKLSCSPETAFVGPAPGPHIWI
jgi:hypothetical protein